MEYRKNPDKYDSKVVEIQSMLNKALDNAIALLKADSSLPTMLGNPHYFQTLHHRNYIPNGWSKINSDGYFGNITEKAVKCFQEFLYITSNGIVGETTYYFLSQLSSDKYSSINDVFGSRIQIIHDKTNNEYDDFIEQWKTTISKKGEKTESRIKAIIENILVGIFNDKNSSGNVMPAVVYQIRQVLLDDFLHQNDFLDDLHNKSGKKKIQNSLDKATNPISKGYFSQKGLNARIKHMKIIGNINKWSIKTGIFLTVFNAVKEPLKMVLKYDESESWHEAYKNAFYKSMDDLLFGGLASALVIHFSSIVVGTSTVAGAAAVAAAGAAGGTALGAAGGTLAGGPFGTAAGAAGGNALGTAGGTALGAAGGAVVGGIITLCVNRIIKIVVTAFITSLVAFIFSAFYNALLGKGERLSQKLKIFDLIYDGTVAQLRNFNHN